MKTLKFYAAAGALAVLAGMGSAAALAADSGAGSGQGQAIVTVVPRNGSETPVLVQPGDMQVKVNGKLSTVTGWNALRGNRAPLELVILIDGSARSSLGTQIGDIQSFVKEMPSQARMAIAYMENGRAVFAGPLSSDPAQVLNALHLPVGAPGQSASPYFCLSDLAHHWPSQDRAARREVLMITDGVDNYSPRFDPEDPYIGAAITDSVRAGLVVYSFYWKNTGRFDNTLIASDTGQSNLLEVAQATGGNSYWEGTGNPVSFEPFFRDLRVRLANQYRLGFSAALKGKAEVQTMSLKMGGPAARVTAPKMVFVTPAATANGD
ncbi:MAG TPA: hypothetical protein VE291_07830 [Terracidiphilus sp.]|jgi:hypothetical protein|nr:hypothetical protein [Terracidiphilus sp.]